ncbi:ABC transporter permease subunit [Pantoea sp. Acro-805]|uniref:ABC transporter permease subunit n=1 Tax=Candidatus Pantoea formicae TaxID=2608355 RepID=A0ABX0QQ27_9GAMM|nr:ABC transporter permease subunit [Pantoea formicae]MDF7647548.1 ABC transporter permease subunit [Erwiniaceae bacterium L1_54_3]NIE98883.1 ABC transporter permease subunit [Pantoea formicae]
MSEFATSKSSNKTEHKRLALHPLWLTAPGLLFLAIFLAWPTLKLMLLSFQDSEGHLSLDVWSQMFGAGIYVKVTINTFIIALQTTLVCLLIAYPVAYWLAQCGENARRRLMWLILLPFWTSALLKNFAWMVLLSRRGILSEILMGLGADQPLNVLYTRGVVVFAMVHSMLPLAIITMLPTMTSIDHRLMPASHTLGASRAQAFWRIFFPLSMPGLVAACLLIFIGSLGFFITPALLGSPQDSVIGQLLITQVQQLLNWRLAGAIAMLLLVVTLLVCFCYDKLFGMSSIAGGEGHASNPHIRAIGYALIAMLARISDVLASVLGLIPGKPRFGWLLALFSILIIAVLILPVVSFLPMAFSSSSFLQFPPPGFSLRWMQTYLESPIWTGATARSFGIALITGVLAVLIATTAAFGLARHQGKSGSLVVMTFLLPMIVPNIVTAVALFYLFANFGLVGSNLGIILGHTVMAIPVVFIIILTTFKNYDWRLDQAAGTLGASRLRVIWEITLPLIKSSMVAAFIFGFLNSFEELTVALFVGGGVKQTLPKQMWDDVLLSVTPTLAAASVIILTIVTLLFIVAERSRLKAEAL